LPRKTKLFLSTISDEEKSFITSPSRNFIPNRMNSMVSNFESI
jgi:hypothetical protein